MNIMYQYRTLAGKECFTVAIMIPLHVQLNHDFFTCLTTIFTTVPESSISGLDLETD